MQCQQHTVRTAHIKLPRITPFPPKMNTHLRKRSWSWRDLPLCNAHSIPAYSKPFVISSACRNRRPYRRIASRLLIPSLIFQSPNSPASLGPRHCGYVAHPKNSPGMHTQHTSVLCVMADILVAQKNRLSLLDSNRHNRHDDLNTSIVTSRPVIVNRQEFWR